MNHKTAIGIDLGGTRIKGVVISSEGEILLEKERLTRDQKENHPEKLTPWQEGIRELTEELVSASPQKPSAIGLAAPGLPASDHRAIAYMPGRLQGLEGFVWGEFLGYPEMPVINDAQAALWAETKLGAAKNQQNVVLLTLGTGVGGGMLIKGQYYEGFLQRAGHLGHISLNADSYIRGISNIPGSLEDAIGESTIERRTYGKFSSTKKLVDAFENGDTLATWCWLNSVQKLAVGISSLINVVSPDLVVIGGGITLAGDALFGPLNDFMELFEWRPNGISVPIVQAAFTDQAGAIGAALYALYN